MNRLPAYGTQWDLVFKKGSTLDDENRRISNLPSWLKASLREVLAAVETMPDPSITSSSLVKAEALVKTSSTFFKSEAGVKSEEPKPEAAASYSALMKKRNAFLHHLPRWLRHEWRFSAHKRCHQWWSGQ